jgi:hypothetical protein
MLERVQRQVPSGIRGVTQILNSLESLFDKEGLREFGARGLKSLCIKSRR